jgi:hypothetical protein
MLSSSETGEQGRFEREKFEGELTTILNACKHEDAMIRVLGSMAIYLHCPKYNYLHTTKGRVYSNIDFGAYSMHGRHIRDIMTKLGYTENREVFVLSGAEHAVFYKQDLRVDVYYEKLDFCHTINLRDRLEYDSPTIPLAELLLEKMQIIQIDEKDIIDAIMLLLEHPLGEIDGEIINVKLIAHLCADEWGLWRTTTMNLRKVNQFAQSYTELTPEQKHKVESQVNELISRLNSQPKSLAWKVRDQMGDRVKWYKDVEES